MQTQTLHPSQKLTQNEFCKMHKLNVKCKPIKFLGDNIGENLDDLDDFSAQSMKERVVLY